MFYSMLLISLSIVILITLALNMFQVYTESNKLKAEGKTPLYARNLITISVAALAEAVVVVLVCLVARALDTPQTVTMYGVVFTIGFITRNVGAYLTAWTAWSVFIGIDKRKLKKQLQQDRDGAI